MRKATFFVAGLFCLGALLWGAAVETTGVLIDSNCAGRVGSDSAKLADHKVACALSCKDGGFSVVADGKVLKLDAAGNEKAATLLQNTSKTSNVTVKVTGTVASDSIQVEKIEEVE